MSSFIRATKRPDLDKWEDAFWVDDYYAAHHYGVVFADGTVFDPEKVELQTGTDRASELTWANFPVSAKVPKR